MTTSNRRKSTGATTRRGDYPPSVSYREWLLKSLSDEDQAQAYLTAAIEEGDPKVLLVALRDVADAQGGMSKVAARSKLNRESLYRMLSKRGNPSLTSLAALLKSLGFRLSIERDAA
jgi:probable addiction module antidote protein